MELHNILFFSVIPRYFIKNEEKTIISCGGIAITASYVVIIALLVPTFDDELKLDKLYYYW